MNKLKVFLLFVALSVFCTSCVSHNSTIPSYEPHEHITTGEYEETTVDESMKQSTEALTEPPTEALTEAPTEIPTEPPMELPTEPATMAPVTTDMMVENIIDNMTLHEKVCQLFVVAPEKLLGRGTVTSIDEADKDKLEAYPVAGFIFFASNLIDREQTVTMLNTLNEHSIKISGIPFYNCVDEEGGRVARIGRNPAFNVTKIGAMSNIVTREEAYGAGYTIGEYLNALGFNFDFAPDADVITNPLNTVIGDRSFGTDGEIVSEFAVAYAQGLKANNVISTFKHFPGHGSTEGDTHEGYAYTNKTLEELKQAELKPFMAAAKNDVDAVMVAHISVPEILGDNTPCTMSKYMITDVLRGQLGYEGLIITDALGMGAIANQYDSKEAAVKAFVAGNDLLLMPEDFYEAYDGIIEAVETGVITEDRIDESLRRIIKSKILLNI